MARSIQSKFEPGQFDWLHHCDFKLEHHTIPNTDPVATTVPANGFLLFWLDNEPKAVIILVLSLMSFLKCFL